MIDASSCTCTFTGKPANHHPPHCPFRVKTELWEIVVADVNEILKLEELLGELVARREKTARAAWTRLVNDHAPAPRFEPRTRGETILNRIIDRGAR
jgi:hypothetical protein